jgi:hypothetical protein
MKEEVELANVPQEIYGPGVTIPVFVGNDP